MNRIVEWLCEMIKLTINENDAGQRLDRFLKKHFRRAPLSHIYKIIRKDLKINGKRAKEDTFLQAGDELSFYMTEETYGQLTKPQKKKPAKKQFTVIYEDDEVLIVSKPWGLLTHGDAREKKKTLANQVIGYLQEKGEYDPATEHTFVPSPVNRLDRNTSGLVIFGKTAASLRLLTRLIRERQAIDKYYLTIVAGDMRQPMVLEGDLIKDERTNTVRVTEDEAFAKAKRAVTEVTPLESSGAYTLVEVKLITGRTHQIRTSLAHEGYPLVGDAKYGSKAVNKKLAELGLNTQLLHAYKLVFGVMPEELKGLSGKTIISQPPEFFEGIRKELL